VRIVNAGKKQMSGFFSYLRRICGNQCLLASTEVQIDGVTPMRYFYIENNSSYMRTTALSGHELFRTQHSDSQEGRR